MDLRDRFSGEVVKGAFQSQRFVAVSVKKEKVDAFTRTERAYIPPQVQISDMMAAGIRLANERRSRFDSVELDLKEGEDPPLDPMREQGLDLADVSRLAEKAKKAATALGEAVEAKRKEEQNAAEKSRIQKAVEEELSRRASEVK